MLTVAIGNLILKTFTTRTIEFVPVTLAAIAFIISSVNELIRTSNKIIKKYIFFEFRIILKNSNFFVESLIITLYSFG